MNNTTSVLALVCVALAIVLAVVVFQNPYEHKSSMAEAVENVGTKIEDAGKNMDPHRDIGERIGDAVEDAGKEIRK